MSKKITIITATFNLIEAGRKDFFIKCLESVKMQDYDNYEHIIIDGASTDGTLELLEEYSQKGYISYYSEPDTGLYAAFNKGIKKAEGEIIAFLGSDDYYTRTDAFSLIARTMEENSEENSEKNTVDFVCGNCINIDNQNSILNIQQFNIGKILLSMPFCHQTMFSTKKMLEELDYFDEEYSFASDFKLINQAFFKSYNFVSIPEVYVAFRITGISSVSQEIREETVDIIQKEYNLPLEMARAFFNDRYIPTNILNSLFAKVANLKESDKEAIIKYNNKRFWTFLIRKVIRLSRKQKLFQLFGITIYKGKETE